MLELIEVPGPGERSGRVTAVVNAHLRLEAWAGRRALAARLVVLISFAMAYALYTGRAARAVLGSWLLAVVWLALSTAAMLEADRRVEALLRQAGGRRIRVGDALNTR